MEGQAPTPSQAPSTPSSGGAENAVSGQSQAQEGQPKQVPGQPDIFEVKVNGRVMKMTRDEVIAHASMSHAAQQRFEEAAKQRKQVEKIINTAKQNPIEALMDPSLGLTKDQIRDAFERWYTQEFIEPETLSPEQRRLKEYERKVAQYEQRDAEEKQRREQEELNQLTEREKQHLQSQIIDAIDKSGLPKTKSIAKRVAFYMRQNLLNGWEAPLDVIISQVKKERQEELSDIVSGANVPELINILGEDLINKIRKHDLEQLRARRQNPQVSQSGGSEVDGYGNRQKRKERVYSEDVNKRLREIRTGRFLPNS